MARGLVELDWEELLPGGKEATTPVVEIVDTLSPRGFDVHQVVEPDLSCADGITRSSRNQVFAHMEGASAAEVEEVNRTAVGGVAPQVGVVDLSDVELKEYCNRGLMVANQEQNELRWNRVTSPKPFVQALSLIPRNPRLSSPLSWFVSPTFLSSLADVFLQPPNASFLPRSRKPDYSFLSSLEKFLASRSSKASPSLDTVAGVDNEAASRKLNDPIWRREMHALLSVLPDSWSELSIVRVYMY
ncbi:hypothetical protein KSP40_PGU021595 [Platanthera guangdongensis]|uniref:Uncharacterized protein n=1 Tax=Platanthera guangdongensis TaxID=2320717 RepID=A0ABR2M1W5_9ASPA